MWVSRGGRAATRLEITRVDARTRRRSSRGGRSRSSTGSAISNEYVSFGGHLTVDRRRRHDRRRSSCRRRPILRRGGHSQGWDEAAVDLAAFFGRVMIAVDYVPGFEARMAEATPARPLRRVHRRCHRAATGAAPACARRIRPVGAARCRGGRASRRDHPDAWADGRRPGGRRPGDVRADRPPLIDRADQSVRLAIASSRAVHARSVAEPVARRAARRPSPSGSRRGRPGPARR